MFILLDAPVYLYELHRCASARTLYRVTAKYIHKLVARTHSSSRRWQIITNSQRTAWVVSADRCWIACTRRMAQQRCRGFAPCMLIRLTWQPADTPATSYFYAALNARSSARKRTPVIDDKLISASTENCGYILWHRPPVRPRSRRASSWAPVTHPAANR